MVKEILDGAAQSSYDFRVTAFPGDPLRYLFADWVPYYRMKWAIARVLQPRRILEVGVRFGYSAAAFLNACPDAEYLGIDNDSEEFGGYKGAINWARRITRQSRAEYLLADSQQLSEFPGGHYDLIHVDGQQDGAGSFRDLRKALRQARHILVDGFFWTRQNFLNVSEFLYRYRDRIESCVVVPGYEGELLITVRSGAGNAEPMMDWGPGRGEAGGYLVGVYAALAHLVEIAPVGRALDLACARQDLDQVPGAIWVRQISDRYLTGLGHEVLELRRENAGTLPLAGSYDVVVASELIEYLPAAEVDALYRRIAEHLSPGGVMIVHSFPNSWFYRYGHPRRRKAARQLGAYLPLEPRSEYQELRHINEQSPRTLKRQLGKYFRHTMVWFADNPADPLANLKRRFSRNEIRNAGHLFAVACQFPMDAAALRERLEMHPLPVPAALGLAIVSAPEEVPAGARFGIRVRLDNLSGHDLKSRDPHPVHLAYHCYSESLECVVFDGARTRLHAVKAGGTAELEMELEAPPAAGRFLFRLTLVQEGVRWFDDASESLFADAWIQVVSPQ
jgi:hypothetical protein